MEKSFRMQKALWWVYVASVLVLFVYSLWFMTDFKDLFGLQLKVNRPITTFHDAEMQPFNRQLLAASLCAVTVVLLSLYLEVRTKVPDRFALLVMGVLLFALAAFSISVMVRIPALKSMYSALDFSKLDMEGAIEYVPRTRAFALGMVIHGVAATIDIAFLACMVSSHVLFIRKEVSDAQ